MAIEYRHISSPDTVVEGGKQELLHSPALNPKQIGLHTYVRMALLMNGRPRHDGSLLQIAIVTS